MSHCVDCKREFEIDFLNGLMRCSECEEKAPKPPSKVDRLEGELFSANVEIDNLRKMLADANAREQALLDATYKVLATAHTCENAYGGGPECPGCKAIIDLGNFRPVPMCKIDPVGDLFPPACGEVKAS